MPLLETSRACHVTSTSATHTSGCAWKKAQKNTYNFEKRIFISIFQTGYKKKHNQDQACSYFFFTAYNFKRKCQECRRIVCRTMIKEERRQAWKLARRPRRPLASVSSLATLKSKPTIYINNFIQFLSLSLALSLRTRTHFSCQLLPRIHC